MATGASGWPGPSVPSPVEEDLKIAPGLVTRLFQPMVERIARENLQSPHPAKHSSVSSRRVTGPGIYKPNEAKFSLRPLKRAKSAYKRLKPLFPITKIGHYVFNLNSMLIYI